MADANSPAGAEQAPEKKMSKLPLVLGIAGALVLGGGGFYAVYTGLLLAPEGAVSDGDDSGAGSASGTGDVVPVLPSALADVAFVPLDPLVISLGGRDGGRHLRFRAELEVEPAFVGDVTALMPRVLDVLNSYLRAVDIGDIENPAALVNLRAQMLRRIQLVTGQGRVRDLLVTEFVVN